MHPIPPPPKVLVVDDDEGLGILATESLREAGIEAAAVQSAAAALESLRRNLPDLVLLDLELNDLSGPALLKRLNDENIAVPFIIVTGQGDERVAVEMMKLGALDYLIKDAGMLDRLPMVVKRAAEKLERERVLASVRSALVESEKKILSVSEEERQRIGADLHDNLGQRLTAIELHCHSLKEDLHGQPALEVQMGNICRYLQEAVAQARQLARGLMPVPLDGGLADGLAEMVRRMSHGSTQCEFICSSPVDVKDLAVSNQLFRIAQEAVNNAMKHARAKKVTVTLSENQEALQLWIEDNGTGLPKTKKRAPGLGLQLMRHRANVIGATLETKSSPGKGLKIICTKGKNA